MHTYRHMHIDMYKSHTNTRVHTTYNTHTHTHTNKRHARGVRHLEWLILPVNQQQLCLHLVAVAIRHWPLDDDGVHS